MWSIKTPVLTGGSGHCWIHSSHENIRSFLHQLHHSDLWLQGSRRPSLLLSCSPDYQCQPAFPYSQGQKGSKTLVQPCWLNSANSLKLGIFWTRSGGSPGGPKFMQWCSSPWTWYYWVIYWHLATKQTANTILVLSKGSLFFQTFLMPAFGRQISRLSRS